MKIEQTKRQWFRVVKDFQKAFSFQKDFPRPFDLIVFFGGLTSKLDYACFDFYFQNKFGGLNVL